MENKPKKCSFYFNVVDWITHWIWNLFSFELFHSSIWLHSHKETSQFQFTISTDAIAVPYVFFIPFWLVIRIFGLTFFSLSLSFSECTKDPLNHRFFLLLQKFTIIRPTDRSYALVFFFSMLPVVCAPMVILMFVFIYSWFCCLCDKDGSTNRFEFLLKWYTSLQYFSLVQIHHALWFIAWNCFVQLTYSLICYYYYLFFFNV